MLHIHEILSLIRPPAFWRPRHLPGQRLRALQLPHGRQRLRPAGVRNVALRMDAMRIRQLTRNGFAQNFASRVRPNLQLGGLEHTFFGFHRVDRRYAVLKFTPPHFLILVNAVLHGLL